MDDYYQVGYKWCQCDDCGRPNPHRCFTYTHCCWDCLISDGTSHSMECDSARLRRKISRPAQRREKLMLLEITRPGEIQLRLCITEETPRFLQTCIRNWRLCTKKETPGFLRTCIRNWVLMKQLRVYLRAKWLLLARMAMTPPLLRMD